MQVYGIIPSRYQSTRLEAKALADIAGKPMFWHVYTQACKADIKQVFLATDDTRIEKAALQYDIPTIMTSNTHNSGTDRIHEAATIIAKNKDFFLDDQSVIINIQGDEPLLEPEMLNELITPFKEDPSLQVCTLAHELSVKNDKERFLSPNTVKIVLDKNQNALYFSRSPIPHLRDEKQEYDAKFYAHIGLYAFRYSALQTFTALEESFLEQTEKLEQLRLLENATAIRVVLTKHSSQGVDTIEDLEKVRQIFSERDSV